MLTFTFHSLVVLSFFLSGLLSLSHQTCFNQAGTAVPDDHSCSDTDEFSFCCGEGWNCLEDFVCIYNGTNDPGVAQGTLARGTCTDQSWQSPNCPHYCESAADPNNNGNFIQDCKNGTGCCQLDGVACSCLEGSSTFVNFTDLALRANAPSGPDTADTPQGTAITVGPGIVLTIAPGEFSQMTAFTFQQTSISIDTTSASGSPPTSTFSSSSEVQPTSSSTPSASPSSLTTSSSSSNTAIQTSSSTFTSTSISLTSSSTSSSGSGGPAPLTPGEIAGIVIGAVSATIAIITAIIAYLNWKRPKETKLVRRRRPHTAMVGRTAATALRYFK